MRIVQLVPSLEAGELAQETLEFAQELARQGQDSVVISSGGALVSRLTLHNCRHFELPLNQTKLVNARLHRKLRQLLESLQADILLCRGPVCAWHGARIVKRLDPQLRPRLVTSIHQWPSTGLFRGRRINPALAAGELVLSASDALGSQLSQRYLASFAGVRSSAASGADSSIHSSAHFSTKPDSDASASTGSSGTAEKLRTLYRGVNTRELDRRAPVSGHWHHRLLNDFPQLEERNWLLLPGAIGPGRGQERFLEVLASLKGERPDIFGLVVGDVVPGQEKFARALEQRAESMGLAEYVLFLGARRDMRELYASARITFDLAGDRARSAPSSGRIVAESLAMGCPAIATAGTGVELLKQCFPQGLVLLDGDGASASGAAGVNKLAAAAKEILERPRPVEFSGFSLAETTARALGWFEELQANSCV